MPSCMRNQEEFLQLVKANEGIIYKVTKVYAKGKDIFLGSNVWWWYLPTMGIVLFFISRWGYRCYRSITASAEKMLREVG